MANVSQEVSERAKSAAKNGGPPTAPPSDYQKAVGDVVGYWDSTDDEAWLHFIPREAKILDSKIDRNKSSTLILCELVDAAFLLPAKTGDKEEDEDAEAVFFEAGSMFGIWAKPGMRDLKTLADVDCWIRADGEKDTGKPSKMKLFDIRFPKGAKRAKLPFADMRESKRTNEDEDLPF